MTRTRMELLKSIGLADYEEKETSGLMCLDLFD